ncbi:MAG: sigma-70 family RNA polymerase sigma factor [Pirellulales bacterium]|jgi:RNA polymerase primary sigma factor
MPSPRRKPPTVGVQNPLETYLRDINDTALLTADDEKRLATAIGRGDAAARDHMVRANLRLVVNIARGYANRGLPLPDLIEEGNLGLLRAVEGFDPTMGTRFSTYASYWIKQSIKRALINSGKTIRIPAYMVELLSKWRRASARLLDALGRTPTPEEVARSLGLARKKLPIIKKAIHVHQSAPQTEQADGGWSLGDIIRDENTRCPAEVLLDADTLRYVLARIERLDDRAATILRLRFGLGGGEPMTLKQIGAVLGLTRERVRQIESETLASLAAEIDAAPRMQIRLRHGA